MKKTILILTFFVSLFVSGQGDTTSWYKVQKFNRATIFIDTIKYKVGAGIGKVMVSDSFGNALWLDLSPYNWHTYGNSGTNSNVNFIGTTDTAKLNIGVNDTSLIQLSRKKINLLGDTITHSKGAYSGAVLTSDASGNASWQGSVVYHVRDSISSTQILNSYTSPDTLIPAAGVGYSINIQSVRYYYAYNTAFYTVASVADIFEGDTINPLSGTLNYLLKSFNTSQYGYEVIGIKTENPQPASALFHSQSTSFDNKPVTFYSKSSNPTGGGGYLIVYIDYTIQKD